MQNKSNEAIRQRFLQVDTSNVADVLDTMGLFDQGLAPDFRPFPDTVGKIAGFAYTIRGQMVPYPLGGDPEKMAACQGLGSGDLAIWSGDGEGICYFGELIAIGMKERGAAGALVDGGVRDVRWLAEADFPVYARYRTPVQSIGRWRVTAWQCPVSIRGATTKFVRVTPGDFVLGDADGIIVVPADRIDEVLTVAEELTSKEKLIRAELRSGLSLEQALEKYGHV